jgi:hypothetical protein
MDVKVTVKNNVFVSICKVFMIDSIRMLCCIYYSDVLISKLREEAILASVNFDLIYRNNRYVYF